MQTRLVARCSSLLDSGLSMPGALQSISIIIGNIRETFVTAWHDHIAAGSDALRIKIGKGVDVLHLATHGVFDAEQPLQSAIYLSEKGKAVALTAADVFENPLPARLVALSACETGMGESQAGDDLLGLPRSFHLSGASSVLSALWPVDDAATKLYMETFHREVVEGQSFGQAWLSAREELKLPGFPPSAYGAFILGGAAR